MPQKIRLDLHLLTKGFAESRQKAQQLIRAGMVQDLNGKVLDKPGHEVSNDLEIQVKESPRFVSRGGEKLLAALTHFSIEIPGRICLDGGISTGGFTDCLLQHGASKVYGIDVGYGQVAWRLRNDSRVVLMERTNLRLLSPDQLYKPLDLWANLAVIDLSFISLRLVLPAIRALLKDDASEALLLIKPQFEVGKSRVGKGGVVRDPLAHIDAIEGVLSAAEGLDWEAKGLIASPITGPAGNHEYLLWLGKNSNYFMPNIDQLVASTLN